MPDIPLMSQILQVTYSVPDFFFEERFDYAENGVNDR